jgi:hypothetical protein
VGTECELNSACAAPLVCRLGHCRNECASSVDCPNGTACVLDSNRFGACQLADETSCALASECPQGLVCRFNECTNGCETDRDCPGGARCTASEMGLACLDSSGRACNYDAECGADPETGEPTRCIVGRCRRECFTDRDCRNDFWCNGDEGGVCWPLPRSASADAGVRDAPTPPGCVPSTPLWVTTQSGIDETTLVATVAGHLLLSSVTDPSVGPGGTLYDLDLSSRAWSQVPFAEARQDMAVTSGPGGVFITGGHVAGGDPYLGTLSYSPGLGVNDRGLNSSAARRDSTIITCNTNLIVAGGTLPDGSLSSSVDVLELTAFGRELALALPEGRRGVGAGSRFADLILAGGDRESSPGVFEASDTMFSVDCIGPAFDTPAPPALPRPYHWMWGFSADDEVYFVGEADPLTGEGPYDYVEVYTWGGGVTSIHAPPPEGAGALTSAVLVAGRLVRAFDGVMDGLDLVGGGRGCVAPLLPAHRLASDGDTLLVITIESGTATVSAHAVP